MSSRIYDSYIKHVKYHGKKNHIVFDLYCIWIRLQFIYKTKNVFIPTYIEFGDIPNPISSLGYSQNIYVSRCTQLSTYIGNRNVSETYISIFGKDSRGMHPWLVMSWYQNRAEDPDIPILFCSV